MKIEFPDIKQTLPITYTYKKSRQVPKNGYHTPTKPIFYHWKHGLKILLLKELTQNFGIKTKIESETDQSKYTKMN